LVPGLGITLAIQPPGTASLPVRVALAFGFGYATISLTSLLLAFVHALAPVPLLLVGGSTTAAAWALAIRKGRAHLRAIRDDVALEWPRYLTFLAVLGGAIAVRLTYSPIVNFIPPTLRYWSDGVEIADVHRIPTSVLQWGRLLTPTVSKVALNSFDATMSFFLGRGPLGPTGALLFVVSVGLVLVAYAFAEELGVRWLGPVLPVLLFVNLRVGNTELTSDLRQNLAEDWGRLVVLATLILAIRALKPRDPVGDAPAEGHDRSLAKGAPLRDAIVVGVMFAVSVATHLIPTAAGLAFAGGYALVRMVLDRGVARVLRTYGVALVTAALVGGCILLLPGGDLGFKGAGGNEAYDKLRTDLNVPSTFDPGVYLYFGSVKAASRVYRYSASSVLPDFSFQVLSQNVRGESKQRLPLPKAVLPSAAALIGVLLILVFGNPDLRAMAGAAVIFAVVLIGAAIAFAIRFDLYSLETFGNRRLFNYVPLPFALVAVGLGELLVIRAGGAMASDLRRWAQPSFAAALSLGVAAILMPSARAPAVRFDAAPGVQLVEWIGQHDPCQGRILADRRTLATFEAFDGRPAVLEGMGPYVRPDVLEIAVSEMFAATRFFEDPKEGLTYLEAKGVAFVVSTTPNQTVHVIGGWRRIEGPSGGLSQAHFLTQVFQNDAGTVYQVDGFTPNPTLPDPAAAPGYCRA
jgi:hypothetical protein